MESCRSSASDAEIGACCAYMILEGDQNVLEQMVNALAERCQSLL